VPDTAFLADVVPAALMGRGVLRPGLAAARFDLARHQPAVALAPFVDFFWIIR